MPEMTSEWIIVLFLGIALDRWIAPYVHARINSLINWLARHRDYLKDTPEPPKGFQMYSLGNIEIPVMNLFGTPQQPYRLQDVAVDYNSPQTFHEKDSYPEPLKVVIPHLTATYLEKYGRHWTNNYLPRLEGYTESGETENDERGKLTLHLGRTSFYSYLATNRSLDQSVIPESGIVKKFIKSRTIREAYVRFPYVLEDSFLSNTVSANVVVISRNPDQEPTDQILIRLRSAKVALYPNCYQVAAAGYVSFAHMDVNGSPSPFVTAVQEARQEIADGLALEPDAFKLIGLALNWEDLDLNMYGFVETQLPSTQLIGDFSRDAYEGWLEWIPFTPMAVMTHIAENRWEPVSAFAMCGTLLAKFPRQEVEAASRSVPAKNWRKFLEQDELQS